MVLWELTVATAYFLGLKRTYKLALRIQRRVIPLRFPRARNFVQRRTRNVFDVALSVHRNIQKRDLALGRSIGTRILRWLDRLKPSANIRGNTAIGELPKGTEIAKGKPFTHANSTSNKASDANKEAGKTLFSLSVPKIMASRGFLSSKPFSRNGMGLGSISGVVMKTPYSTQESIFGYPARSMTMQPCQNASQSSAFLLSKLHLTGISRNVIREDIASWAKQ